MELMEIKELQITMIMSKFSPALDLNNTISTAAWAVLGCRWPDAPWPAKGNNLLRALDYLTDCAGGPHDQTLGLKEPGTTSKSPYQTSPTAAHTRALGLPHGHLRETRIKAGAC